MLAPAAFAVARHIGTSADVLGVTAAPAVSSRYCKLSLLLEYDGYPAGGPSARCGIHVATSEAVSRSEPGAAPFEPAGGYLNDGFHIKRFESRASVATNIGTTIQSDLAYYLSGEIAASDQEYAAQLANVYAIGM